MSKLAANYTTTQAVQPDGPFTVTLTAEDTFSGGCFLQKSIDGHQWTSDILPGGRGVHVQWPDQGISQKVFNLEALPGELYRAALRDHQYGELNIHFD